MSRRFYKSSRHTIQIDPITYNDSVSQNFGAKPSYFTNISILWRLVFSSNGPAQWRLNGPDSISNAQNIIKSCPVPDLMKVSAILSLIFILFLVAVVAKYPILIIIVPFVHVIFKNF